MNACMHRGLCKGALASVAGLCRAASRYALLVNTENRRSKGECIFVMAITMEMTGGERKRIGLASLLIRTTGGTAQQY